MPPDKIISYLESVEEQGLLILANAVRRRRVSGGASQRQVATWAGIHQSTLSRLETGRLRTMRLVTFARVVGVLRMPPEFIVPGDPPPPTRRLPSRDGP